MSLTSKHKLFKKLKEINPAKCYLLWPFHPIQQCCSFRFSHSPSASYSLSLSLPLSHVTDRNRADPPHGFPTKKERKETKRKRTRRKYTIDRRRTKTEEGGCGSTAEWNPFRNCKPPCSMPPFSVSSSSRIRTSSRGLFPTPSLRKSHTPTQLSLSLSPSPANSLPFRR